MPSSKAFVMQGVAEKEQSLSVNLPCDLVVVILRKQGWFAGKYLKPEIVDEECVTYSAQQISFGVF